MEVRKNQLWRVPVICLVSGLLLRSTLMTKLLLQFGTVTLPGGTKEIDDVRVFIIYLLAFLVVLLVGGFLIVKDMTQKEIILSASIVLAYNVIVYVVRSLLGVTSGPLAWVLYSFTSVNEWGEFIYYFLTGVLKVAWTGSILAWFLPYLFVLFGKK